jgi:hypothetical protein
MAVLGTTPRLGAEFAARLEQVLDRLQALGIDDDLVQRREDDGVAAFDANWGQLSERLATTLRAQSAQRQRC